MRILITGASGFVGENIIPVLNDSGSELLLCGRSPQKLKLKYPKHGVCGYDEIAVKGRGCDAVVHLAVLNNNNSGTKEEFFNANVERTLATARAAEQAGIRRFIFVSSLHALDPSNKTLYALSKREAAVQLDQLEDIDVEIVHLPYVYGKSWGGKLVPLNHLPSFMSSFLFRMIAALKPTVHAKGLAQYILRNQKIPGPILLSDNQDENIWYLIAKRCIDLCFAISCVIVFGWLFVVTWLVVKLQSTGPGIFAQERVGKGGKVFTCYKFRTMKQETKQAGTHEVTSEAITSIGRFLRKTKIDELPQVWNIICNEMSLVGPRPCLPVQTELVESRQRGGVLSVKPGITGLAQINGIDMSCPPRLTRWDQHYIATRSLILDIKIVLATFLGRGQGDHVRSAEVEKG